MRHIWARYIVIFLFIRTCLTFYQNIFDLFIPSSEFLLAIKNKLILLGHLSEVKNSQNTLSPFQGLTTKKHHFRVFPPSARQKIQEIEDLPVFVMPSKMRIGTLLGKTHKKVVGPPSWPLSKKTFFSSINYKWRKFSPKIGKKLKNCQNPF